jgi:hypothetical protein
MQMEDIMSYAGPGRDIDLLRNRHMKRTYKTIVPRQVFAEIFRQMLKNSLAVI